MPQVGLLFFYRNPEAPDYSDCVVNAIDNVLANLPAPIAGSRVSEFSDNIIVLEVSTDIDNISNIVHDVPGNLDIALPCLGYENMTFTLARVETGFEDATGEWHNYTSDLSPANRDLNLVSFD